jgi:pyridoxine 5-phosphate synthase
MAVRLGVNIDHVATVRNARGVSYPDPVKAALLATDAGADGITAHLREDRRHIRDADMRRLKDEIAVPLNFEMAATDEMAEIALGIAPHACCLVPERREELTTEGGLDVAGRHNSIAPFVRRLSDKGIRVSLFIDADPLQIDAAVRLQAPVVELHTGRYCEAVLDGNEDAAAVELNRIRLGARLAFEQGLEVHAGHGLDYATARIIAAIPEIRELNIGHFLIADAIYKGLPEAVREMKAAIADGVAAREHHRT